jgi:excisionase family DNA binding protein
MQTNLSERAAFSVPEVQFRTGLCRDRVYSLIKEGKLVARKIGRRTLITATDLEAFLQSLPTIGRAA